MSGSVSTTAVKAYDRLRKGFEATRHLESWTTSNGRCCARCRPESRSGPLGGLGLASQCEAGVQILDGAVTAHPHRQTETDETLNLPVNGVCHLRSDVVQDRRSFGLRSDVIAITVGTRTLFALRRLSPSAAVLAEIVSPGDGTFEKLEFYGAR